MQNSWSANVFFKMGQSRPLFVYFCSFHITISIQIEKSVDGVLGIRTRGRRMVGTDKTTELWWPPLPNLESFSFFPSINKNCFNFININWKSIDGVHRIRTRGHRMEGVYKTMELWKPPQLTLYFNAINLYVLWKLRAFKFFWPFTVETRNSHITPTGRVRNM